MKRILLSVTAVFALIFVLASCGEKLELPKGYPTATFPVCEPAGIVYSNVAGLEDMPIYSVNYESKVSVEDVLASYMPTIPDSDVFDTETGYMLAGKKDTFRYTIYIDEVENAENRGAKTLVKTMISMVV